MKINVSTTLEEAVVDRISKVALGEMVTSACIIRKCIVRHLPELEREILGETFVGTPAVSRRRKKLTAAPAPAAPV